MKTRTLLLLALACGVAIMLAGAVFLFQLANQDELDPPVEVGTPIEIGDVTATVTESSEADGTLVVGVQLVAPDAVDATTGFHLIASGRAVDPDTVDCATEGAAGAPGACRVTFDVADADGTSRVLFYERGDEQARWVLG